MPGKPIEAQLCADIEAAGGWESIWDRVANGETQTAIAESLGISQGFLSRVFISTRRGSGRFERPNVGMRSRWSNTRGNW